MADIVKKNISYLGRDFSELKSNLQIFAKTYFQDTYQDFSEADAGTMLLELAAYVGDVLGFHMDSQFKGLYADSITQRKHAINYANMFGYKVKPTIASTTKLDVYIVVPATGSADNKVPDYKYCPILKAGATAVADTSPRINFETLTDINFLVNTSQSLDDDGRDETIYEVDESGIATKFLLRKRVDIIGSETRTFNQTITSPEKYLKIQLPSNDITEIISVLDSDGNNWYEVECLAQDTIFIEQQNIDENDTIFSSDSGSVPYLLKLKKVPKRFEVKVDENNLTYLLFGSGIINSNDEEIIPNPRLVGSPTPIGGNYYDYTVDPENFLKTKSFGEAPANTTLTITYRAGGGIQSNVQAGSINSIENVDLEFPVSTSLLNQKDISDIIASVGCINNSNATGGRGEESVDSIKYNAIANYKSQKRCVTKEDYIVRAYSLPAKFGSIAKIYVEKDDLTKEIQQSPNSNPFAINMYLLAYNSDNNLVNASTAVKNNLKTYINQYRMLTDNINIIDGTIINIGIMFEIIVYNSENKNEVLLRCIDAITNYFDISNWSFNQPIVYAELYRLIMNVKGVQAIPIDYNISDGKRAGLNIICKSGGLYSNTYVDLEGLTINGIIYPPRTISIFELKTPQIDIEGRAISG